MDVLREYEFDFYDRSFMEILDDYIFVLDSNGQIYYVNNIVLKELECDLDNISKNNFFEISSFISFRAAFSILTLWMKALTGSLVIAVNIRWKWKGAD